MGNVNEGSVQNAIAQLRSKASQFTTAAQDIQARAMHLAGISLDITYSASDWAGGASQAFQSAWGQYDLDSHKAIEALNSTANAFNNLAQRLETALQTKREAEQRANALLVATVGLTLLDIIQLGMDPATDALTAGTAAGAAAVAAESIDLGTLVVEADMASEAELAGVTTTSVGSLSTLTDYGLVNMPVSVLSCGTAGNETTGTESPSYTQEYSVEDGKASLFMGYSSSLWSNDAEVPLGQLGGNPLTATGSVEVLPSKIGLGVQEGEDGTTNVGLESSVSLLSASDGIRFGTKDLGATAGLSTDILGLDGNAGWIDNSMQADVGANLVSDTGSVGVNLDNVNFSVNGTIGIKAELGFSIGEHTEIKLPFISFGFSIG